MSKNLKDAACALSPQLQTWRRHLHAHPELSNHEEHTARYIADALRQLGLEPTERVGDTWGLTATLGPDGPNAVALRADMDALPITEATDVAYVSQNPGTMHACGHDAHVAMLLGAATLLAERQDQLQRPVRLLFQPAEELFPGGAKPMIDAGVLKGVSHVFGLHIWSEMPTGTIGTRVGPFMASPDDFQITVRGRGGHAAMPQQCVDPVLVASTCVMALQSIVSRGVHMAEHAVVSVTQINAGTASNVIPEVATLAGTIRTLNPAVRQSVHERVRQVLDGIAATYGADIELDLRAGYPPLVNDRLCVEHALQAATAIGIAEEDHLELSVQGGGEDFAYFAQERPAAFLFLGARSEATDCCYPHHHPRFNIDEAALPLGAALLARLGLHPPAK
jgi:amidohydrolase